MLGTDEAACARRAVCWKIPVPCYGVAAAFAVELRLRRSPAFALCLSITTSGKPSLRSHRTYLWLGTRALPERVVAELVRCYEDGMEAVPATTVYESSKVVSRRPRWRPTGTRSSQRVSVGST